MKEKACALNGSAIGLLQYVDRGCTFWRREKGSSEWRPATAQQVVDAVRDDGLWEISVDGDLLIDPGMRPSVIVYGAQGCGKTRNAEALRQLFKLAYVRDLDPEVGVLPSQGTLFLTTLTPHELYVDRIVDKRFSRCWAFESVMRQIRGE